MLKHLVHSHHGKLQTFDEFYKSTTNSHSKVIKSRSTSNETLTGTTTNHSSSPSPTSPCSPNSNPYTFYNVFADFKFTATPDAVIEEDENEEDLPIDPRESQPVTPVFYLDEEHHHHHQQQSQTPSTTSSSPHWPSLILNRFRHSHPNNHSIFKQNSVNENQMNSTKLRKSELCDPPPPPPNKHRFLKRSETTIDQTDNLTEKKYHNEDFPELSLPTNNFTKKHRSLAAFFHHSQSSSSSKSSSTGTLHSENSHEINRTKISKHKPISTSLEIDSPVKKSPTTPLIPKLASLFHRHHLSEQHKYRVGNLKARLHHRRHSPPMNNPTPKFHCQMSDELIRAVQELENEQNDYIQLQRSLKPVIMKRVHTWHNTFDLRPLDQCLEY